jgi:hypothetical protein
VRQGRAIDRASHGDDHRDHDWDAVPDWQWRAAYDLLSLNHGFARPVSPRMIAFAEVICAFVAHVQDVEYQEYADGENGVTLRGFSMLRSLHAILGEHLDDLQTEIELK